MGEAIFKKKLHVWALPTVGGAISGLHRQLGSRSGGFTDSWGRWFGVSPTVGVRDFGVHRQLGLLGGRACHGKARARTNFPETVRIEKGIEDKTTHLTRLMTPSGSADCLSVLCLKTCFRKTRLDRGSYRVFRFFVC